MDSRLAAPMLRALNNISSANLTGGNGADALGAGAGFNVGGTGFDITISLGSIIGFLALYGLFHCLCPNQSKALLAAIAACICCCRPAAPAGGYVAAP